MPKKLTYEYVKDFINEKGYELISKEYNNSKELLDMQCGTCNEVYKQSFDRFKIGYCHPNCENPDKIPFNGYKRPVVLQPVVCLLCKNNFQPKHSIQKLCSIKCKRLYEQTEQYKKRAVQYGQKGGKISAKSQSRRSKNEIYFAELCRQYYDITTNEQYFDGWDADIIIHSEKIAILWNGAWHYKQISKTQSLKQVLARDKIKLDIINKYGYTPYIIKDMGKYNKGFVEQEFEIFRMMQILV